MTKHIPRIKPADQGCINVIQITDLHLYASGQEPAMGVDSVANLKAVIRRINGLENADLVIATGDLVHEPAEPVYKLLAELLRELDPPVFCLPGNHDDAAILHRVLGAAGFDLVKAVDCGAWRILLLDSVVPGSDGGLVSSAELEYMQHLADGGLHVIACLHHHPVMTGSSWMDTMIVANAAEFLGAVRGNPRIKAVVWGHIHQEFHAAEGDLVLLGSPSTCVQVKPLTNTLELDDLPPAYRRLQLYPGGQVETAIQWLD